MALVDAYYGGHRYALHDFLDACDLLYSILGLIDAIM